MGWAQVTDLARPTHPQAVVALATAEEVLRKLTGHLISEITTITEMYETRTTLSWGAQVYPTMVHGVVYNAAPGCECSGCGIMHRIRLRNQPVRHLVEVIVGGRLLLPTEYILLDHAVLGFLTSDACGAGCVIVRYQYGSPAPLAAKAAAVELANELVESTEPDGGNCRLPQRVTSVSRQGVSWTMLDQQDFLTDGRTGLYLVDLFLKTFNPVHAYRPVRVFSVDRPRAMTTMIADPPLAEVIQPNDLIVVPGSPTGWLVDDSLTTVILSDPKYTPRLVIGDNEWPLTFTQLPGGEILFNVPAEATTCMRYGTPYCLVAHNTAEPKDVLLLKGEAKTL